MPQGRVLPGTPWKIIVLCGLCVTFDGYDLVVYGTTVPALMSEWGIGPAEAGRIGSYALIGMLIGALVAGTVSDLVGRRRTLLACVTWFSALTALTAAATSPEIFGLLRLLAGIGLGGLMPIAAALVVEYAAPARANLTYVVMQSGYPVGAFLASILAIPLLPTAGWRVMYLIGAAPLVLVLPFALRFLPESLEFLVLAGRTEQAKDLAKRLGRPIPEVARPERRSWTTVLRALVERGRLAGTLLLWLSAFCSLLIVYGMNTWLPQIMREAKFPLGSALSFLAVFSSGAIVGTLFGGRLADRYGAKRVIVTSFLIAAASMALMTITRDAVALYALVALAGYGTIGTQTLLNVHITRHYPASLRPAGVGWALGIGRLGAVLGPTLGGLVLASGVAYQWNFWMFAAVALVGLAAVSLVPTRVGSISVPNRVHSVEGDAI